MKFLNKTHLTTLLAFLSLNVSLNAEEYYYTCPQECCYSAPQECCDVKSNKIYIGGFGGEVFSNKPRLMQRGTAFFLEAQGGPLAVLAEGRVHKATTSGYGGVQVGFEWAQNSFDCGSNWTIAPAAEFEALFYSHTKKGDLFNPSERLPEHDFLNTFPMDVGVYLINGVISLNSCQWEKFSPYIGGGVGAANISIRKAKSFQIDPPEVGVNHFDSDRGDTSWTFAAQAKAGVRYNVFERFHIFAEYRFLFIDSTRYLFGSTVAPGHAVTTPWFVDVKDMWYNAFAVGLRFDLY